MPTVSHNMIHCCACRYNGLQCHSGYDILDADWQTIQQLTPPDAPVICHHQYVCCMATCRRLLAACERVGKYGSSRTSAVAVGSCHAHFAIRMTIDLWQDLAAVRGAAPTVQRPRLHELQLLDIFPVASTGQYYAEPRLGVVMTATRQHGARRLRWLYAQHPEQATAAVAGTGHPVPSALQAGKAARASRRKCLPFGASVSVRHRTYCNPRLAGRGGRANRLQRRTRRSCNNPVWPETLASGAAGALQAGAHSARHEADMRAVAKCKAVGPAVATWSSSPHAFSKAGRWLCGEVLSSPHKRPQMKRPSCRTASCT